MRESHGLQTEQADKAERRGNLANKSSNRGEGKSMDMAMVMAMAIVLQSFWL